MQIDRSEVLRYLGYGGALPDERTAELIETCCAEIGNLIQCRSIWKPFAFDAGSDCIQLQNAGGFVLQGEDIRHHLADCRECVLMAATLGNAVDRHITALQVTDMTRALILDCCATAAIEAYCDEVQEAVHQYARDREAAITFRYSPGYGDLPIDCQRAFVALLDAPRRIGLTASMENILIPRKSVTAIIGICPDGAAHGKAPGCEGCRLKGRCPYGRTGCTGGK